MKRKQQITMDKQYQCRKFLLSSFSRSASFVLSRDYLRKNKLKQKSILGFLLLIAILLTLKSAAAHEQSSFSEKLGWIESASPSSLCGGYYQDLAKKYHLPVVDDPNTLDIHSDTLKLSTQGYSWLKGHVRVTQGQRHIYSNAAKLWREKKTGDITNLSLAGPITWIEPGLFVTGQSAQLHWQHRTGQVDNILYRVGNAWGSAEKFVRSNTNIFLLSKATYTTCPPTHNSWQIEAAHLLINHKKGRGYANHIVFRTHNFPVFYFPYFNFPTDKRRMTGFLYPTFSHSNHSGYGITIPYYFNLAPNYDMTFSPNLLSQRGPLLNLEGRYLTTHHSGIIHGHILPHDRAFVNFQEHAPFDFSAAPGLSRLLRATSTRKMFAMQHASEFNRHWSGQIDLNYASDDYYLQDFGGNPNASTDNQLLRQAQLNYVSHYWYFSSLVQSYQTLHPINQTPIDNVYSRKPLLRLGGQLPMQPLGMITHLLSEWTNFHHSSDISFLTSTPFVTGNRLHFMVDVQRPWYGYHGFFTPRIRWLRTQYDLQNNTATFDRHITRSLPVMSVDSGLFMQRKFLFHQHTYYQTLEPRLYYLYSPIQNQRHIPVFDTASQPFNFDNMFSYNRFSGIDRVSDANQFAFALTTRVFNRDSGKERLWASIGSIYYLKNRHVTLCQTLGCQDTGSELGANSSNNSLSPLVASMNYLFDGAWQAHTEVAWSPSGRITNNANINLQYHPDFHHIMNLSYTFIRNGDILIFNTHDNPNPGSGRNNLNQGSFDSIWPIGKQWHAMLHWTYNISHRHSQLYLYGLQYESCCWAFRAMASHNFKGLNQNDSKLYTNNIYIQWLFKGLGRVGTSPDSILSHMIAGYHNIFGEKV